MMHLWPLVVLLVVLAVVIALVVTVLPAPISRVSASDPQRELPVERDGDSDTEHAWDRRGPWAAVWRNGRTTTAAEDNDWLMRLKAACDAGYYKAGSDEPLATPPDDAACHNCVFWLNGFCRLACRQREAEAAICAFFIALPAPQAMEHQGNEIPGTPTGERA